MPSKTRLTLALVGVALLALAGIWATQGSPAPRVGSTNLQGQTIDTPSLIGKPYLVNFWATSCVTCVREMPDIVALHKEFESKGFRTIAVAMHYDKPEFLGRFVEDRALPFWVIHDTDGRWAKAWGDVSVTPTTFVVDSSGQIHKRYVGVPDFEGLRRWLRAELPG